MPALPTYKDFQEKSENFKMLKIDTIQELKKFLADQQLNKGIYRGIGNAAYKIYTSLQREIIVNNLTGFDIKVYVDNVRKQPALEKYFKTFNIPASKLSIYSYLQHYEAPSPYLDFTTNINTALFFATEKFDTSKTLTTQNISDYFSIFFISEEDQDVIDIKRVLEGLKKYKDVSKELFDAYRNDGDGFTTNQFEAHLDNMLAIHTCQVFLMNYNEELTDVYNTLNNIRIIAQDGLFIHNDYPDIPLEMALKKFLAEFTVYQPSPTDADIPGDEEREAEYRQGLEEIQQFHERLNENIINSIDIHKSLIPEIRKMINLTRAEIYPDPLIICKEMFEKSK